MLERGQLEGASIVDFLVDPGTLARIRLCIKRRLSPFCCGKDLYTEKIHPTCRHEELRSVTICGHACETYSGFLLFPRP